MLHMKKDKTVYSGTESISSLAPKVWELLPRPLKTGSFKQKIKTWVTDKCSCQLCKKIRR